MKVAFVNCWTMPWGVLNVLQDLLVSSLRKHWADVEIVLFTLISNFDEIEVPIPWREGECYKVKVVQTLPDWINNIFLKYSKKKVKVLSSIFDYRNLMVFYPELMKLLSRKIKAWWPDEIEISSFAIAKNITPIPWVPTHLYLHSPMQYIWSHYEEYNNKFKGWKKRLFNAIVPRLRKWDKKYVSFSSVTCNSEYTKRLAEEIYWIKDAKIKYPKISDKYRFNGVSHAPLLYCVYVGRLVNFVRETWLIIRLFNELHLPLIVIWSWPDEASLKAIAWDTIIFTGWNPEGMQDIVRDSSGLINLTKESFWIGTVEALLMGVPVFWYSEWATSELVDEKCWVLAKSKDIEELKVSLKEFLGKEWDRKEISERIREKLLKYK